MRPPSRWTLNGVVTTLRRFPILLSALGLAALASAQTVPTPEQHLQQLYDKLRAKVTTTAPNQTGLYFVITGTDKSGSTTTNIGGELFYTATLDSTGKELTAKANVVEYVMDSSTTPPSARTTFEAIADARTIWAYNPKVLTYSATPYDSVVSGASRQQSPNYLRDMLFGLDQQTPSSGRGSYAIRLLRELMSGTAAQYRSWMPGVAATETVAYHDKVTGADVAEQNCSYVIYDGSPRRSIAFEIYSDPNKPDGDPDKEVLQRIYFSEAQRSHVVAWSIAPIPTTDFSRANFSPYDVTQIRGWRPVTTRAIKY